MKRGILSWPAMGAAWALVLWFGFCTFTIGVPTGVRASAPIYWSPAVRLLDLGQCRTLASLLESLVNGVWDVAPYSRCPKPAAALRGSTGHSEIRVISVYDVLSPSPQRVHQVLLVREECQPYYDFNISSWWPQHGWISLGDVLLFVLLIPGAHFAAVVFAVVVLTGLATRAFGSKGPAPGSASD